MKLSSWTALLIIIPSILFEETGGDFLSGANQAVRCMLSHTAPENCASLPKVIVPSYLLQVYNDSPPSLHEAFRENGLAQLSEKEIADIPLSLLYLIPRARLADLNGNQLRAILHEHADDTSLVHQVAACLHHGNNTFNLIDKLKNDLLPTDSLQILAESVEVADVTEGFLNLKFFEKDPFLAYLRPAVMFGIETNNMYAIVHLLQLMEAHKPPNKSSFYFITEATIRHKMPLSKLNGIVLGLNPDQLLNDSLSFDNSVARFKLDLSILQARALFERIYRDASLSSSDFIDSKPVLFKLSPELLRKFPQNVQKYEVDYIERTSSIPLPTACQIMEYVKAECILAGRLPKEEDNFWGNRIRNIGKWVYTLPLSALEEYKNLQLSTADLNTLESPAISPIQAYYLTQKGEALDVMTPNSVLELDTFLHALPASQLIARKLGEISSHVLSHLVSKLPANNLARTLSLVNKIAPSIGDEAYDLGGDGSVLEELLGNSDVNRIMSLLSPKDLALSSEAILKLFGENKIRNTFGRTIEQLPQPILAALLEHARLQNSSQWRWNSLLERTQVSHLLVGGLTCHHIEDMDTGLFIPIMHHYNSVRKKTFPKNLQHCGIRKLINHLKLKMSLSQTDSELGLISLLEPIEINSVGGFVLIQLPLEAMRASPYLGHLLSSIGRLSTTELMLSADINRLKQVAQLAVDKEGNVNTFFIRNLVWFLPSNTNTRELRLMLEAQLLDTSLCLPAEQRSHIAARLMAEFGPPEQWSAGVLATLQDLLIVFGDEELKKIPESSWTKAGDSLLSHYDNFVDWIEPSIFYKVCARILGETEGNEYQNAISRYVRWRLKAAQWLLNTVVPISQPEVAKENYVSVLNQTKDSQTPLGIFDLEEFDFSSEEEDEDEYEDSENNEMKEHENVSTKKYEDAITAISTEKTSTEEHTTEKPTTEKIPTSKTINDASVDHFSGEGSYENTTTKKPEAEKTQEINSGGNITVSEERVCSNSVDKESCQEDHAPKSDSTESKISAPSSLTKGNLPSNASIGEVKSNRNDSASHTFPQTTYSGSNMTNSSSLNNLTDYSNTQHSSMPVDPPLNHLGDKTTTISSFGQIKNISTSPKAIENNFNGSSEKVPSPQTKNETFPVKSVTKSILPNNSNSENSNTEQKYNISGGNQQSKSINPLITNHQSNTNDSTEWTEPEKDQNGIIHDSKPREKRSIFNRSSSMKLTCKAVKMVGRLVELSLTTSDIDEMSDMDISDCRMEFGAMDLNEAVQKQIWKRIRNELKLDGFHLLGKLLRVSSVADLWDIKFSASQPWTLETIHSFIRYNNNTTVMKKLVEKVMKDNAEYSVDLLAVLGPTVCSLDPANLRALSVIGLDLGSSCTQCLPYLAQQAIKELGNVNSWSLHFVHSLQAIVAGLDLDNWKQLAASYHKPLAALQPAAAKCLSTSHLEILSPDQIMMIPAMTLLSLSENQVASLNSTQQEIIKNITHPVIAEQMTSTKRVLVAGFPTGGSNRMVPTVLLITVLNLLYIWNIYK